MRHRIKVVLSAVILMLIVAHPAAAAQGNSENAKACQKGGYVFLIGTGGETFANAGDCVSYAAQGGGFLSGIVVPAGRTATFSATLSGCNGLAYGYSASDGSGGQLDATVDDGCRNSPDTSVSSTTVGPFPTAVVLTVYMTDTTCDATYTSGGGDGHAVVVSSPPIYQVDIADAGSGCGREGSITGFRLPGNLSVQLVVHP